MWHRKCHTRTRGYNRFVFMFIFYTYKGIVSKSMFMEMLYTCTIVTILKYVCKGRYKTFKKATFIDDVRTLRSPFTYIYFKRNSISVVFFRNSISYFWEKYLVFFSRKFEILFRLNEIVFRFSRKITILFFFSKYYIIFFEILFHLNEITFRFSRKITIRFFLSKYYFIFFRNSILFFFLEISKYYFV